MSYEVVYIPGPSEGRDSSGMCDVSNDYVTGLPDLMRGSLIWDQGTEMVWHAVLTIAADLPVYFAHPCSLWGCGSNENTNRLIREYLPKGHRRFPTPALLHGNRGRTRVDAPEPPSATSLHEKPSKKHLLLPPLDTKSYGATLYYDVECLARI